MLINGDDSNNYINVNNYNNNVNNDHKSQFIQSSGILLWCLDPAGYKDAERGGQRRDASPAAFSLQSVSQSGEQPQLLSEGQQRWVRPRPCAHHALYWTHLELILFRGCRHTSSLIASEFWDETWRRPECPQSSILTIRARTEGHSWEEIHGGRGTFLCAGPKPG